jgi:hypothetical protein
MTKEREMTKERAVSLAATLEVGLHSPGVCPACISFVAMEIDDGNERRVAGQITSLAPLLWDEGLGDVVRTELERQARGGGGPDAVDALAELELRRERSPIFRAVVRRLGAELAEEVRRSRIASLN